MGLSDGERISMISSAVLPQRTRVTDGRNWRGIRAIAYMLSRVKTLVQSAERSLRQAACYENVNNITDGEITQRCYRPIACIWIDSKQSLNAPLP